jgi:hypothetical protein
MAARAAVISAPIKAEIDGRSITFSTGSERSSPFTSLSSRNTGVKGSCPILEGSILRNKCSITVLPLTVSFSILESEKRFLKEEIIRSV